MAIHMITGEAGVEHVTSANAGALNAMEVGTGKYVFDLDQKFNYNLQSNNIIRIYKGQGIINGRHFEMSPDQYQDLEISNGAQNEFRKDLVVVRYSKNLDTGKESGALIVIEGESVSQDPVDPAYNNGSILDGESVVDFPLYRINIEGLNVTGVDKLFQEFSGFKAEIDALNTSLSQHSTFPSGVGFYPDEKDGVKGYNTDPNRGADTFSPFKSGGEILEYGNVPYQQNNEFSYKATQPCKVFLFIQGALDTIETKATIENFEVLCSIYGTPGGGGTYQRLICASLDIGDTCLFKPRTNVNNWYTWVIVSD